MLDIQQYDIKNNNNVKKRNNFDCSPIFFCCPCVFRSRKSTAITPITGQSTPEKLLQNNNILEIQLTENTEPISKTPIAPSPRRFNSQDSLQDSNVYLRQTLSSDNHFYSTPPAESYLPPIDNGNLIRYKSHSSLTSKQSDHSTVLNSPMFNSSKSLTNLNALPQEKDGSSSSAYVTSERSTSFESSPAKSDKKSDSDFDIEDDEAISTGYKTPSSTGNLSHLHLSNPELINNEVFTIELPEKLEYAERKNINSAPTQIYSSYDNLSQLDQEHTLSNSTIKSLPGSMVSLNKDIKISDPSKQSVLLRRQKITAKQTAGKLLNGSLPSARSNRMATTKIGTFPDISQPFDRPREAFNMTINQLDSANWETIMTGLQNLVRLIKCHSDVIDNQMHPVAVALARQIRNLRSQVARTACLVASELFNVPRKSVEMEMEELAAPLLHRTADTNKFLRADANTALNSMCTNMSTPRVIYILATRGAHHQNAIVRSATARLIGDIVERLGHERVFQLPRDTRDRILITSANLLTEGSLETRNYAKQIFKNLMKQYNFQKIIMEVVPACTMRHISKTLKSIK